MHKLYFLPELIREMDFEVYPVSVGVIATRDDLEVSIARIPRTNVYELTFILPKDCWDVHLRGETVGLELSWNGHTFVHRLKIKERQSCFVLSTRLTPPGGSVLSISALEQLVPTQPHRVIENRLRRRAERSSRGKPSSASLAAVRPYTYSVE